MSVVSFQEMLADATKRHYAVPMFDVSNGTMMRAAVEVAQEENSPVMPSIRIRFMPIITAL